VADKSAFGHPRNGAPTKARNRRRGADPPKNESEGTGPHDKLPNDMRRRIASSENGTCIAVQIFSIYEVL
jgi:hypothetical protein